MDRRLTPSNGRVAHVSLRGQTEAEHFVEGEAHFVKTVVADLCNAPSGARDRQLLRGGVFVVLDMKEGWAFGFAEKDNYVGWVSAADLIVGPFPNLTHTVSCQMTYGKSSPGLKDMGQVTTLPFGCVLSVLEEEDSWVKVAWSRGTIPQDIFVPSQHLRPFGTLEKDPVAIAERLIGSPYLWGGNSAFGIDCSGLVQAALLACGIPCPGDSDLQESAFPDASGAHQRGDLLFWKGHVAMVVDAETLIHANAHHMAVVHENIEDAIARIANQGDGPVISHKRPVRKEGP